MAIATMGVRSALRSVQETNDGEYFNVVDSLASGDNKETIGAPKITSIGDSLAAALEKISAWIPSEAVAIWLVVATGADLFKHTDWELVVGAVMIVASGVYAFFACRGAHDRRGLARDVGQATKTAIIASYSFAVYWIAMPGSVATADWNWPSVVPVMLAFLTVLFLPQLAQSLKIEPITTRPK